MRKLSNPYNISDDKFEVITKFWKEYGKFFNKDTQYNFKHYLLGAFLEADLPLLYLSIYSYLKVLSKQKDVYKWFLNYLKDNHKNFLDQNILEVSCGSVPALIKLIAEEIESEKRSGTVTGIDKELIVTQIKGAELKKDSFSYKTDISSFDTIIGYAPCEATPIALRRACLEKKELSIAVCECLHPDGHIFYNDHDKLLNHYYRLVKREISGDFTFEINKVPKQFDAEFPILTLKRK